MNTDMEYKRSLNMKKICIDWNEDWEEEDPFIEEIPLYKSKFFYRKYIGRKVRVNPYSIYYCGDYNGTITHIITDSFISDHFIKIRWKTNPYRNMMERLKPCDIILEN